MTVARLRPLTVRFGPFIKEQSLTIGQLIAQKVAKLGENIGVRRFARFKIGEPNFTVASAKVVAADEPAA